jgi:hypothetical protein
MPANWFIYVIIKEKTTNNNATANPPNRKLFCISIDFTP